MSYLAKFSKNGNGEEKIFHKWDKSDLTYNHIKEDNTIHNTLMQKLNEQLEGSSFVFQEIGKTIIEI